jgi:NFU1 iron-sulfur cluster scaffold homolog, mitochondrial
MAESFILDVEPIDEMRCNFILDRELAEGVHHFASCEEAREIPVAEAVLGVPGIAEVVLSGRTMTVVKHSSKPWSALEEPVRYAIDATMMAVSEQSRRATQAEVVDDDAMFDLVSQIFDREVNPSVARHGGRVDLIDVQDATVIVRMQGGCQGCGMASVTLRQGIEGTLRRVLPALKGIHDITDHAAGTNPYFESQKK